MNKKQLKTEIEKIKTDTASVVVALQFCQENFGYISKDAVATIADVFAQSRSTVYSTATFYHQFSFVPKGKNVIAVCMGTACFVCGAEEILRAVETELGIKAGEVTSDGLFSIEHNTRCVGRCDAAPVVTINDKMLEKATVASSIAEIKKIKEAKQ